jgi:hypothetical protein
MKWFDHEGRKVLTKIWFLYPDEKWSVATYTQIHPSNGATAQIGPWPPLLRFYNNNILRYKVVSLTTDPR